MGIEVGREHSDLLEDSLFFILGAMEMRSKGGVVVS